MYEAQVLRGTKWEKLREEIILGKALDTAKHIHNQCGKSTRVLDTRKVQIALWEARLLF